MSHVKVVPTNPDDPAAVDAAKSAEIIVRHFERHFPERVAEIEQECAGELVRQLLYGSEPSVGMPDVRPTYPRYEEPEQ